MIIDAPITLQERRLHSALAEGLRRAQQKGRSTLVSTVARVLPADPLAFFEHGARAASDRSFWSSPGADYIIAGVGIAWAITVEGPQRFADAAAAWRDLCSEALIDGQIRVPATGPILMGGFAFDPLRPATKLWEGYPDGLLVLPRYMLTRAAGKAWLTINTILRPDSSLTAVAQSALRVYDLFDGESTEFAATFLDHAGEVQLVEDVPPAAEWKAIVGLLEQELRSGDLGKVVLARQSRIRSRNPFEPARILHRLRAGYPDCFTFAVVRGGSCFLGASPERLVRLQNSTVHAACLAGSIARGATPEEDQRLGEALLASAKDQAEHAFVARAICDALAEVCMTCGPTGSQTLMKLRNVQHLFTPIAGHVGNDHGILDLVERLHPTPAVGGYPTEAALRMIREREGLDRGWYAGPVGWLDAHGQGEFAVAIRSALLRRAEATLFAGCGIVAGSDPEREYAESCLKLRSMLSVLGGRSNFLASL